MQDFLFGVAKGMASIAEKIGLADKVRKAEVKSKSEVIEKQVLDPAIETTSWMAQNWQFAIIGLLAILVLLRD